ncbi:MAG: ABC transporter substrate-binding protein [Actinomycetota bacterium]
MNTKRMRRTAFIGAVASVLAAGLLTAPSSQAAGTIKIGYINATIGPFAGPAPEITKGFNLALAEIKGTVNGKKIVVIEEASDATPQLALEKAKKLVEKDKVDIVFGPLSGDEGVAIANYSKKVPKVTFINTTSSASEATLVAKSPNFFRFHGDAAQWSGGVGEIAYKDLGYRKVAIIADDYSFPYANAGGFATGFCKAGGQIVAAQWPALGTKDYSSQIAALPKDIDAVYAGLGGADAVQFLKQAAQFGLKKPLIGGAILVDGSVLNSKTDLGDAALNTIAGGPVPDSSYTSPLWDKFVKDLASVGTTPNIFNVLGYNSAKSMLAGLVAVKGDLSNNQSAYRKVLSTLKWDTPTGPLSMDKNRNAIVSNFIYQVVSDGKGGFKTKALKRQDRVAQGTKVFGRVNSCADVK